MSPFIARRDAATRLNRSIWRNRNDRRVQIKGPWFSNSRTAMRRDSRRPVSNGTEKYGWSVSLTRSLTGCSATKRNRLLLYVVVRGWKEGRMIKRNPIKLNGEGFNGKTESGRTGWAKTGREREAR